MYNIIKLVIFIAGCAVIYGLATGQDLNVLFSNLITEIKPVITEVISATYSLFKEAMGR